MKLSEISPLGWTGISIPPIIYGTSFLGNLYKELPWETKLSIIKEWFASVAGPVVIDTAGKYGAGLALEVIGNGLRELGISPDQIIISNKLGWKRVALSSKEPTLNPVHGSTWSMMLFRKSVIRVFWTAGNRVANYLGAAISQHLFLFMTLMNILLWQSILKTG